MRTHKVVSTKVGPALLGRVVDALGDPHDGKGAIKAQAVRPVEAEAPKILDRQAISRPLATGIKAIDAAVPIGLGQRQLVIGDRQTGKTSLAVDAILNQKNTDVICIYCAIGQRGDAVAKVIGAIREGGMMARTIIMSAGDEDAAGLAYIAPYAALTMAEYFAGQSKDVLVMLDDLTHHARSYRELVALAAPSAGARGLSRRHLLHPCPIAGTRGAVHRSGRRWVHHGAARGRDAGRKPVRLYSDQPDLDHRWADLSVAPPCAQKSVSGGRSGRVGVSRVGGKAQSKAFRSVAGNLRVTLSQFEELEDFARFGTRLDDATRARLTRGAAVRASLRQAERDPIPAVEQLTVLVAAMEGQFDGLSEAETLTVMTALRVAVARELGDVDKRIDENAPLSDDDRTRMVELGRAAREVLGGGNGAIA